MNEQREEQLLSSIAVSQGKLCLPFIGVGGDE